MGIFKCKKLTKRVAKKKMSGHGLRWVIKVEEGLARRIKALGTPGLDHYLEQIPLEQEDTEHSWATPSPPHSARHSLNEQRSTVKKNQLR